MQTVRGRLRAATADIHEALHRAEPFARIADGTMDRQGYGALLERLARYHLAMAPLCAAGAAALGAPELDAAHRDRVAALKADIRAMGASAPRDAEGQAVDPAFAVGCLYVVNGSTLGGKVIFRQLDALLADDDGRRFFKGRAEDGAHWQTLCRRLEDFEQGGDYAAMEAGARSAFARFGDMLATA